MHPQHSFFVTPIDKPAAHARIRSGYVVALTLAVLICLISNSLVLAQPVIQPGAPGEGSRDLSAEQAIAIANTS